MSSIIRSMLSVAALTIAYSLPLEAASVTHFDIIKSTYEGSSSEENGRNLMKYLATDARWREADGFPLAGVYIGPESIEKNVFQRIASDWAEYRFEVEGYIAQGDKVAAYGTYKGVYGRTGKYFEARVTHIWTLKDQKIIAFEQFVDSKPVVDAMQ